MNYPKISIVTPSYNQGQYLEQTILSIIGQNYPNLEYIIIDGGSTDNSLEIIKKYEKYLTYWVSEKDRGQSHAINKGLTKVTGDICNWINSDDLLAEGSLWHIGEYFAKNDIDVLCGYLNMFKNDDITQTDFCYQMRIGKDVNDTIINNLMNQPATFYKSKFFKSLGYINEDFHYSMDFEFWCRYLLCYGQSKIGKTESILAHFRLHDSSKTSSGSNNFAEEWTRVFYAILYQLKAPNFLLESVGYLPDKSNFKPVKPYTPHWDISFLNKKIFLLHFINYYLSVVNAQKEGWSSIKCLIYLLYVRIFKS